MKNKISTKGRDIFDILNWLRLHGIESMVYFNEEGMLDHIRVIRNLYDFEIVGANVRGEDYGGTLSKRGMRVAKSNTELGSQAYVVFASCMDIMSTPRMTKLFPHNFVIVEKGDNYMKIAHAVMGFDQYPYERICPVCAFRHASENFL